MKATTVLLDAGGVIIDESEHEKVRVKVAIEVLGRAIPGYSLAALHSDLQEAVEVFCPKIFAYVFWKHLKPNKSLYKEHYESFLKEWHVRRPPLRLSPGLKTEIADISRSFSAGVAGQYGQDVLNLLERHDLLGYFRYRLTQDDFTITKPDPRYLEQISQVCGVDPRECIMVGDRLDNDIIPAKQVGMKTILVRAGVHKHQRPRIPSEIPDLELDGIEGLARAVSEVAKAIDPPLSAQ